MPGGVLIWLKMVDFEGLPTSMTLGTSANNWKWEIDDFRVSTFADFGAGRPVTGQRMDHSSRPSIQSSPFVGRQCRIYEHHQARRACRAQDCAFEQLSGGVACLQRPQELRYLLLMSEP